MKQNITRMAIPAVALLLALVLLLPGGGLQAVQAQQVEEDDSEQRTVTVVGTGSVSAQPDVAIVSLGVQAQAEQAEQALDQANQRIQSVTDALQQAGIAQDNIQTELVRLEPRFAEPATEQQQQGLVEVTGFVATNVVQVRVENVDQLGQRLDTAVQAGANDIRDIRFIVEDQDQLLTQARREAWQDARSTAQNLAQLAGLELGQVLTINETAGGPVFAEQAQLGVGGTSAVPIEPGLEDVQVSLQVTWLLQEAAEEQQQLEEETPTVTPTEEEGTLTVTPTVTSTPTEEEGTLTVTPTVTLTPTEEEGTLTVTPTVTSTPTEEEGTLTVTPTPTEEL